MNTYYMSGYGLSKAISVTHIFFCYIQAVVWLRLFLSPTSVHLEAISVTHIFVCVIFKLCYDWSYFCHPKVSTSGYFCHPLRICFMSWVWFEQGYVCQPHVFLWYADNDSFHTDVSVMLEAIFSPTYISIISRLCYDWSYSCHPHVPTSRLFLSPTYAHFKAISVTHMCPLQGYFCQPTYCFLL